MTGTTPTTTGGGEHYSRLVRELCALLLTIVSPASSPDNHPRRATPPGVVSVPPSPSPVAAASMLLGASVALMLCGSVTFAIGLLLMPWVAGLALLFGFAGAVNTLSSGLFLGGTGAGTQHPAALPCKPRPRARGRLVAQLPAVGPGPLVA